ALHGKARAGVRGERGAPDHRPPRARSGPVHLRRRVIGAGEPQQTVSVFQSLFALPEMAMNGGPRTMLTVGQGALLVVPAEEVGGSEGMVALSLVAGDFDALIAACTPPPLKFLPGTGEVPTQPTSRQGVHRRNSKDGVRGVRRAGAPRRRGAWGEAEPGAPAQ